MDMPGPLQLSPRSSSKSGSSSGSTSGRTLPDRGLAHRELRLLQTDSSLGKGDVIIVDRKRSRKTVDRLELTMTNRLPQHLSTKKASGQLRATIEEGEPTCGLEHCKRLVADLMSKHGQYSWPFHHPVDAEALACPDYYDVIKHPQDLSTIRSRLDGGVYASVADFAKDIRQMFANCYLYNNPAHNVVALGKKLQAIFERHMHNMPQIFVNSSGNYFRTSPTTSIQVADVAQQIQHATSLTRDRTVDRVESADSTSKTTQQLDHGLSQSDRVNVKSGHKKSHKKRKTDALNLTPPIGSVPSPFFSPTGSASSSGNGNRPATASSGYVSDEEEDLGVMSRSEIRALSYRVSILPPRQLVAIVEIVQRYEKDFLDYEKDDIELDFDKLKQSTLRAIDAFIRKKSSDVIDVAAKKQANAQDAEKSAAVNGEVLEPYRPSEGQDSSDDDDWGSLRFVGSLESVSCQPGIWAGVEWDQEKPGLHDGTLKGKRFFQARQSSASFILASKLSWGITALDAVREKYGTAKPEDMEIGVRFGMKDVVAVGWEKVLKKVNELDQLHHVDLTGLNVNDHDTTSLSSIVPNVETLSIGKSLISSWSAVMKLISGLTNLNTLNLTDNRLSIDTEDTVPNVKRLVLSQNALLWRDVLRIMHCFPDLEELYLSENQISEISSTAEFSQSRIAVIDLDSQRQPLSDWNEILKLGDMPNLRTLQLSGNQFRSILVSPSAAIFRSLTHLTLRLNEIADWRSISSLNHLPRLENLKINSNPILESVPPETARQWVIARIAGLRMLNQTPVTCSERRDSELDYMRRYGADWLGIVNSQPVDPDRLAAFLAEHPRYQAILGKFGPLEAGEVQSAPKQLKDSLIKVTLQFEEKRQEKSLPLTITVMKLKRIAERLFRLPETGQLWYSTPAKPGMRYVLDDDQKDIAHYDIKSGDVIVIS
ncbi:Tubulin-specific chaperone E [Hypsibius exemplaris]|uniref:Tubulin-specific chaperone E n=1 Tax=Hypsibius exemplaris TaxID=2072580 RepID=A0A1W0X1N6_HYPEX|nr:Tubulin-specific chaperone E [Hypsibius exemplaris]